MRKPCKSKNLRDHATDPHHLYPSDSDYGTLAKALWCIPFSDIRVYPLWFSLKKSDGTPDIDKQAESLIHEWMHRNECKYDIEYDLEYPEHPFLSFCI